MTYIKDWNKYYSMEESSKILDERIKKRAKIFAEKVVKRNKTNRLKNVEIKEVNYV